MWLFVSILCGLCSCSFIILALGLVRAGRRADECEDKILEIISPASLKNAPENTADAQTIRIPLVASAESRISVEK